MAPDPDPQAGQDGRAVLWFRRDLRLRDHGALLAAGRQGEVLPLFVLDPALLGPSGAPRVAFLLRSLRALDADLRQYGAGLVLRTGDPRRVLADVVREFEVGSVHVSADFGPYGARRDREIEAAGIPLVRSDTPYAVAPGEVRTQSGTAYKVFTPFFRAWADHGWPGPAPSDPGTVGWLDGASDPIPTEPDLPAGMVLPEAGEQAGLAAWERYREHLGDYPELRDRPDLDLTSRMSPYLKFGQLHPRTLLADLGEGDDVFRKELAWREFYAAVLSRWPETARDYVDPKLKGLAYVDGGLLEQRLTAWQRGLTGYPLVDAGMRQLLGEGWMHNRVRMLVASFLVKDLGVEWTHGARHFMRHLVDGDLASNQHGWQWAAGTGTDAAPYIRIFNPTTQARRFDPDGRYIRRWIPELRTVEDRFIHEPWRAPADTNGGYPAPIVDHAEARAATLADYEEVRRR